MASERTQMHIGFLSPSFRPLEINWQFDYETVKLGVPTVMGWLHRAGMREVAHWDFDAQICEALEDDPSAFDLRLYFDPARVAACVAGSDRELWAQTERILDTLGVTECDVYGISLAAVIDRIANIVALAGLGECLSSVLKRRHPHCRIVFGGLKASPESHQPELYGRFMEECPAIDYSVVGTVGEHVVALFRDAKAGLRLPLPGVLHRAPNGDGGTRIVNGGSAPTSIAQILSRDDSQATHHPAHTRTGAAEYAQKRADALAALEVDLARTVPLSSLLKDRPNDVVIDGEHHPYDDVGADAHRAHPQEYEAVSSLTPVFDPALVDRFRYSGAQIMKRSRFDRELMLRFSRFENDRIAILPHIFVTGCNAPCGFCAYAYKKIRGEHVAETVAGLKWLSETYECRNFHFLNTQINSVYEYADTFCDEVIRQDLNILWSDCCNLRMLDERLLDKMRRAGAMRLVFGVEAPEDEMLRYIRKGVNVAKVERLLRASHELGIWNHVLLIAGMPHETREKQDRMMDFLVRTASSVDFYSISSFYLIQTSPWGEEPDKWGIRRISDAEDLLEQQAFDEVAGGRWSSDGLPWPEKKQQIVESTARFYKTIGTAKGQHRCVGGNIDLYLLMFLYQALGHDRKREIVEVYERSAHAIGLAGKSAVSGFDAGLEPNAFRIRVPVILGRMNEADQSSLVQVPVDIIVTHATDEAPGFCRSRRYAFAYRKLDRGALGHVVDHDGAAEHIAAQWDTIIGRLGAVLGPFAEALDDKLAPESPARMSELVVRNLVRYGPWVNHGYDVVETPRAGRTIMQRNLEWSGIAGSGSSSGAPT